MKNLQKTKRQLKERRHKRIGAKIQGTDKRPRLSVFRSLKHIYVQLIDDSQDRTLVSTSDMEFKKAGRSKKTAKKEEALGGKLALAHEVGELVAKRAIEKGIKEVVFDKGSYKYHGRVKAIADGARVGGLKF